MLWTVCHLWPPGARFVFNCYRQNTLLLLQNGDGTANIIHSREGVTQGDPLDMGAYGIGFLPRIKCLKTEYPDNTQPWYAKNDGTLGTFNNLELYFNFLKFNVLERGYYTDPTKTILIVHPENIVAGKWFSAHHGFTVFTVARYLGGYIQDNEYKHSWLKKRTYKWERNICVVTKPARKYPQEIYAAVVRAIQSEWIFLKCMTKDTEQALTVLEKVLWETFLPHLFWKIENLPSYCRIYK